MKQTRNNPIRSASKRGFTLIEVLATMVLLGILLPVCMRAISVSLSAASQARHVSEAATLAQSKLNDLVAEGTWNSTAGGDFSPDHPDYRWSCQNVARDYGTFEVMVTVSWQEKGQERQMNLSTFVNDTAADTTGTTGTTQ